MTASELRQAGSRDLNVLHAIPSVAWEHGGPSQSLTGLLNAMSALNTGQIHLACGRAVREPQLSNLINRLDIAYLNRRFWCPAPNSVSQVGAALEKVDIVHVHSYWNGFASVMIELARRRKKPVILSPRGCLQPDAMRRSSGRLKRAFGMLCAKRQLGNVTGFHFQTEAEAQASAMASNPPFTVIDNGVNLPDDAGPHGDLRTRMFGATADHLNFVFLGRIARIKGIDLQLLALRRMVDLGRQAHLHLIGPDSGDLDRLHRLSRQMGIAEHVHFHGPVYSEEKGNWLQAADAVLMTSEFENNSNAALEALAAGGILVATEGIWSDASCHAEAALSVPRTVEDLAAALTGPLNPKLRENARRFAARHHGWNTRAARMIEFYESVL